MLSRDKTIDDCIEEFYETCHQENKTGVVITNIMILGDDVGDRFEKIAKSINKCK